MHTKQTLEVPIDSIEAARLAAPMATRLEVCHDLATEGWTPKMDLVRACRDLVDGTPCTIVAMIRPEYAGCRRSLDVAAFTTTRKLMDLCLREIDAAAAAAHDCAAWHEGEIDQPTRDPLAQERGGGPKHSLWEGRGALQGQECIWRSSLIFRSPVARAQEAVFITFGYTPEYANNL